MDPNKLTTKSQEAVQSAQEIAIENSNQQIDVWHLLYALVSQNDSVVPAIFGKLQIKIASLKEDILSEITKNPKVQLGGSVNVYATNNLAKAFDLALKQATSMGDEFISTEHLFIGLLDVSNEISTLLQGYKLDKNTFLGVLKDVRGSQKVDSPEPEGKFQVLEKYTINLTKSARDGKLDPVIGRDSEIRRAMQVLLRRTKNNPVLLGEPGTGKTAIVEGLAQRIVSGDVPENLRDKEILSLDIGALLAGAKFRGEFEDRLKAVLKEIDKGDGRFITFIDELHTLVGAGASDGAMDASNMLKPALARGELRTIGATTLKEYRQYVEKDAALERRFQPVFVGEPTKEDTIAILRGIKEKYELHHGVKITDEAILAAVDLSTKYISDRFLPDKAIDLIDEATSSLRMQIESMPTEIDDLERSLRKIEIEEKALEKEKSDHSKAKIEEIKKEKARISDELKHLKVQWNAEKELIQNIRNNKEQIDKLKIEAEKLERDGELDKVAEINYGKLPTLQEEIKNEEQKLNNLQKEGGILKEEITQEDVASVVSKWTGIPVTKMLQSEVEKIINAEKELGKRLIGQKEAVVAVANAIRRNRSGISEEGRPIGSFMFLGPTGVGKTELAKALAEFLFNDESSLIRLDMSEYMESHSVAKFIGSPPGYVGYDEGGQLTEQVRRRPYSVILFDEIEKAHPEVFNIMLQILDDGRLTDAKGRVVDFKNTAIIMTSNVGSDTIFDAQEKGDNDDEKLRSKVMEILRSKFRPEFLNRFDDIIIFHPLSKQEVGRIIDLQIEFVNKRLESKNVKINLTNKARELLLDKGYDSAYGARPLKRAIQNNILDELALSLIEGKLKEGDVSVDVEDGKVIFR